ncbi:ornithine cyclodeaminase [Nakamurella sp. UYEF19]|uniref:ornithine cyclodeaminase family protein n=1 Tax=Nakamurella sp. UYEF19 TaxID=1756392 RepID=UPI00339AFFE4
MTAPVLTSLPFLDGITLASLVSWDAAIAAIEHALRHGRDLSAGPARTSVPAANGEILVMPAESDEAVGVKLVSIAPANARLGLPRIQGVYVFFDATTLAPQLLIDGLALTSLRTPAVSALAVRYLAAQDAASLTVFGTGPQAYAHVQAVNSVRALRDVRVVARTLERAADLVSRLRGEGFNASAGTADAVREADIVVCATTSDQPLFDGSLLSDHACVVSVGSHSPTGRELDAQVFARADRVVVEERTTALREAGDVILAVAAGVLDVGSLVDMTEMLSADRHHGISVFKSVGMGWQDLAVAEAAKAAWLDRWPILGRSHVLDRAT